MAKTPDLTKLKYMYVPGPLHFYYETDPETGSNILRHIRANQRTLEVPEEGITIDDLPPNIIGTEQIKDGTIQPEDLSGLVQDFKYEDGADPLSLLD